MIPPQYPKHLGSGLYQGGKVFGKSLAYGVSSLVKKPYTGAKKEGVKGFTKGVGKGVVSLTASPFVGTLQAWKYSYCRITPGLEVFLL